MELCAAFSAHSRNEDKWLCKIAKCYHIEFEEIQCRLQITSHVYSFRLAFFPSSVYV